MSWQPLKRNLLRTLSFRTVKTNVQWLPHRIRRTYGYSYTSTEVGGAGNIEFTNRPCYNYVNEHKMMMMIEGTYGQSLLNHFKVRASEDNIYIYIFIKFK